MNHPLLAAILFAALGPHAPPASRVVHYHDIHLDLPGRQSGYANKWALIVGANYSGRLKLGRPENDAQELAKLLIAHFGYDQKHTVLLIGPAATKKAIQDALADGKAMGGAGPDDSVLFFFAGHGGASKDGDGGDIYPSDVAFDETTRAPKPPTVLRMEQDVVALVRGSKARHKLLILDCCGSGAVLRTGRREKTVSFQAAVPEDAFTARAFQALTACGETQEASDDAKGGHSPFTYALLQGLKAIPVGQKDVHYFTVNQLFGAMGGYLAGILRRDQTPQCQWLDDGQGEFHFYPDHIEDFTKEGIDPAAEQRMLVAMGPGSFGAWWFQETPWLMPSVRYEILGLTPPGGSAATNDRVKKTTLEEAARRVAEDYANSTDKKARTRAGHLKKLLDAKDAEPEAFQKVLDEIAKDLTEMCKDEADPKDLHYLAVLRHVGGKDDAIDAYKKALQAYETAALADPTLKPLEALCLADLAGYHLRVGEAAEAANGFAQAREVYAAAPPAFRIFTLCSESEAWRKLGAWGRAEKGLNEALALAESADTAQYAPLKATVRRKKALFYMERWQLRESVAEFQQSDRVLDAIPADDPAHVQGFILHCRNDQETATIRRFLGDAAGALKKHRELTAAVREELGRLRTIESLDADVPETRTHLMERLAAALEGQGDCNLFGDHPDLAEASDDYRQAILVYGNLPDAEDTLAALIYKRAIALALPSPVQDLDLAAALVQEAGTTQPDPSRWVAFHAKIAEALAGYFGSSECKVKVLGRLRKAVQDRKKELGTDIGRDQMESLLFACKLLIQLSVPGEASRLAEEDGAPAANAAGPAPAGADRLRTMEDVDQMLLLCRRMVVWGGRNKEYKKDLLFYLRRYYDTAIRAELALKPTQIKEVIEVACEAMDGAPLVKGDEGGPMLVFYTLGDRCHLFLDVPRGVSRDFPVEDQTLDQLRDASRTGQRVRLAAGLRKQLDALKGPLDVRWDDPIVFSHSWSPDVAAAPGGAGADVAPVRQGPVSYFPFDLQGVKQTGQQAKAPGEADGPIKQAP